MIQSERFRCDLREDRVRALAYLCAGGKNSNLALGRRLCADFGLQVDLSRSGKTSAVHERSQTDPSFDRRRRIFTDEFFSFSLVIR